MWWGQLFFAKTILGTLPVQWLNVNANPNSNKIVLLNFKVNENNVTQSSFTVDVSKYGSGLFLFKTGDGEAQKIIKE